MSNNDLTCKVTLKIIESSYFKCYHPSDRCLEIRIRDNEGRKHSYTEILPQNDIESRLHFIMVKAETIFKDLINTSSLV